jgi:hypothetical protein
LLIYEVQKGDKDAIQGIWQSRYACYYFASWGGLSWWSWKPQIEALQKNYRVITPIIEGHGEISLLYPDKYLDLVQNFFMDN